MHFKWYIRIPPEEKNHPRGMPTLSAAPDPVSDIDSEVREAVTDPVAGNCSPGMVGQPHPEEEFSKTL